MTWLKKVWKKIVAVVTVLTVGGVVLFNNGQRVEITHYAGTHLLEPNFAAVYANGGKQIDLAKGDRIISIQLHQDSTGKIIEAFADTLDATIPLGVIAKFTQCKR